MKFIKTKILFMVLVSSFTFSMRTYAQEIKIGLVDFQKALNDVEEGKTAKARLKTEFDTKQKTLDALQNQLKQMKDNLEKQKVALSKDALAQKTNEYQEKFIELQKKLAEFRAELQQKESDYTGKIIVVLKQIVQEIGAKDKYTLIFEKGQDVVLYSGNASDLTPQVISAYNSRKK